MGFAGRNILVRVRHVEQTMLQVQVRRELVGLHIRTVGAPQVNNLAGDDIVNILIIEIGDDEDRVDCRRVLPRHGPGCLAEPQDLPQGVGGQARVVIVGRGVGL